VNAAVPKPCSSRSQEDRLYPPSVSECRVLGAHMPTVLSQTAMVRGCLHHSQASHEVIQAAKRLENSNGSAQRAGFRPANKLARGAAAHKQLLGQEDHAEQYLRLLCQFDPPAVLPFLQSHDSYQCEPPEVSVFASGPSR